MNFSSSAGRRPWLFWGMLALTATFLCFGSLEFRQKRSAWDDANRQHETCRALVNQISRLKTVPKFAVLDADSPQAISARIEKTAGSTLPVGALVSIQPESARRVRNSSYLVHPNLIQLRNVTLSEIASFAAGLEDVGQGLVVSELRLLDPQPGIEVERWSVDLKLTQTIYSANVSRQQ